MIDREQAAFQYGMLVGAALAMRQVEPVLVALDARVERVEHELRPRPRPRV
jgi:hypothetical protein